MTMAPGHNHWNLPPPQPVTVFIGNFGSGKTEIAINYALALRTTGARVQLVDLDIINLFFRSREARSHVEAQGIEVVAPANEYAFADLPILLREVAGAIASADGHVVLDVGGDDLGARVLGTYSATLRLQKADVLQVVNQRRPFTDSAEGCQRMYNDLEAASRLKVTGLVANAHLIHETSVEVVQGGIAFARAFGEQVGVPLRFASVERGVLETVGENAFDCPVLALERFMTSPWEPNQRRGPIGRPPTPALPAGVK
ncbi:MAG: cobalamin biosynthesis protein CbiA [Pseudomonadota bacterium]